MATNNAINNDLTDCINLPVPGGLSASGTPSSSTYLRGDGSWASVAGGSLTANIQTLTSGSTYTPTSGTQFIIVEMIAGGGGSGGVSAGAGVAAASAAGAPGCYAKFMMTATQIGSSLSYSIGAGGSNGTPTPGAGGTGGSTSFGNWSCGGGSGSLASTTLGNSSSSGVTAGSLTTGTGQLITSLRGTSAGSTTYIIGSSFLIMVGSGSPTLLGGGNNGYLFASIATAGSSTGNSGSGLSPTGNAYGIGASGAYVYSQASGSTHAFNGYPGNGGIIVVTEFI